jgi:hypothetical protein
MKREKLNSGNLKGDVVIKMCSHNFDLKTKTFYLSAIHSLFSIHAFLLLHQYTYSLTYTIIETEVFYIFPLSVEWFSWPVTKPPQHKLIFF